VSKQKITKQTRNVILEKYGKDTKRVTVKNDVKDLLNHAFFTIAFAGNADGIGQLLLGRGAGANLTILLSDLDHLAINMIQFLKW